MVVKNPSSRVELCRTPNCPGRDTNSRSPLFSTGSPCRDELPTTGSSISLEINHWCPGGRSSSQSSIRPLPLQNQLPVGFPLSPLPPGRGSGGFDSTVGTRLSSSSRGKKIRTSVTGVSHWGKSKGEEAKAGKGRCFPFWQGEVELNSSDPMSRPENEHASSYLSPTL